MYSFLDIRCKLCHTAISGCGQIWNEKGICMEDKKGKSVAALVLGIIGLFAWFFPVAGFPITIVGLVLSAKELKEQRSYAKAGLVLNIIGLVLCIINASIGAFMGANGMLF